MFTTLNLITTIDGKNLFGSLLGNGSIVMICAIVCVAVAVAVIVKIRKNKDGNKGDKDDE